MTSKMAAASARPMRGSSAAARGPASVCRSRWRPTRSAEAGVVGGDPVARDEPLRALEWDPPGAHRVVQDVLEAVLLVGAGAGAARLGEQVGAGVAAAELEADEVVN